MSIKEKYKGLWITVEEDGEATIVHEEYDAINDTIMAIYQRRDGFFTPYLYKKKIDPQWELPIWVPINSKAILPTLEEAKEYIKKTF